MRLTQGTFSYLPDLTEDEVIAQIRYTLANGWALAVEFTDDPHPRNVYWEMWGLPMFDVDDPDAILAELNQCREAFPHQYIRLSAYDAHLGRQTTALAFIVNRPPDEPGFRLDREEGPGRVLGYRLQPYATSQPRGRRYGNGNGADPGIE